MGRGTVEPGWQLLGKMMAGAYLGQLFHQFLLEAATAGGFSPALCGKLAAMSPLPTKELSDYVNGTGESQQLEALAATSGSDRLALDQLADAVLERVALLTSMQLLAIMEHLDAGKKAESPVCIAIEGTTYEKNQVLQQKIAKLMEKWIEKARGRSYRMVKTPQANLLGTAVAALITPSV